MHFVSVMPHSGDFSDDELMETVNEFMDTVTAQLQLYRTSMSTNVNKQNDGDIVIR